MTSTNSQSPPAAPPRPVPATPPVTVPAPISAAQRVPAREPEPPSVGDLVKDASTHLSTLVRSEIELAKTELVGSVKKAGISIALFVVAAALVIYALTFALIGLGEGLHAAGLPRWASYLVVFGLLVLIAAAASLIGVRLIKRVGKPERTMSTVKDTAAWAKHPTKSS